MTASWPVEVRPSGLRFEVAEGEETVFHGAARAGLRWPTVCGGNGSCGTCFSEVLEGIEHCSAMEPLEQETVTNILRQPAQSGRRLVCQLRITGPITLVKRGVRRFDPQQNQP